MSTDILAAKYLSLFLEKMNHRSLKRFTYRIKIRGNKRHRVQRLLFGTISYLLTIDTAIQRASQELKINLANLSTLELNLLRILTYRMLFDNYCISDIVRRLNITKASLIEKILSHIYLVISATNMENISLQYSFPQWIIEILMQAMSSDKLRMFLESLNKRPSKWIAVNTNKISIDDALEQLKKEGFDAEPDNDFKIAIRIKKFSRPLNKTNLYKQGIAIPVSKASIGVVEALKISPGDIILDACAAPGIKTILISFYLNDSGKIYAIDVDPRRFKRMRYLLRRFHVKNALLVQADAREIKLQTSFDKILIDAPCTSSGMIGISPDIKWRLRPMMINKFVKLQLDILKNLIQQLIDMRNRTEIVYSTCSIFPQENEDLMRKIIDTYRNEVNIDLEGLSDIGSEDYYGGFGRRFYPFIHNTIALFLTRLIV